MKAVPGHHTSWRKVLRDSMTLKSWMGNTEWPCEVLHGNSERCGQVGEQCVFLVEIKRAFDDLSQASQALSVRHLGRQAWPVMLLGTSIASTRKKNW